MKDGNEMEEGTIPFIWEIDNRDAFKTMGEIFKKFAKKWKDYLYNIYKV